MAKKIFDWPNANTAYIEEIFMNRKNFFNMPPCGQCESHDGQGFLSLATFNPQILNAPFYPPSFYQIIVQDVLLPEIHILQSLNRLLDSDNLSNTDRTNPYILRHLGIKYHCLLLNQQYLYNHIRHIKYNKFKFLQKPNLHFPLPPPWDRYTHRVKLMRESDLEDITDAIVSFPTNNSPFIRSVPKLDHLLLDIDTTSITPSNSTTTHMTDNITSIPYIDPSVLQREERRAKKTQEKCKKLQERS
ncbi:hypothetical protein C1645_739871 [Glomus cerebriforme]|uniref:Uncharacterized protein n=1 Tax=Glomus cerebriforme TaxID=658196 RepID=A0A397SXZ1_9GLOM|nr:hypothetical protein C1645_739871 [Glomus cerebriforme]